MQRNQIEICVALDALEKDVDAVVDVDLALLDGVCPCHAEVVIVAVCDSP